jgi:urea transport system substrate-binding protein
LKSSASRNSRCSGTDYVYPRTTNKILEAYLKDKGIPAEDIFVNYTPFGHSDWSRSSPTWLRSADGKKVGVISTINGDANIGFYKELAAAGISADDIPVVAFSVGEEELSGLDTANLVGHLAAWNYFQSADAPKPTPSSSRPGKPSHGRRPRHQRPDGSPLYRLQHVGERGRGRRHHRCGRRARRHVRPEVSEPDRRQAEMLPNHHITKPVLIGEIQDDGQFDIVSQTEPVPGDAWTDFLPESAVLEVGLEGTRLRHVQHRDQDLRADQFKLFPLPPSQLVLVVPCFASSSSFLPL